MVIARAQNNSNDPPNKANGRKNYNGEIKIHSSTKRGASSGDNFFTHVVEFIVRDDVSGAFRSEFPGADSGDSGVKIVVRTGGFGDT